MVLSFHTCLVLPTGLFLANNKFKIYVDSLWYYVGSCEHGNESLDSIKYGKYLEQLGNC
jgi:hypothetical protein